MVAGRQHSGPPVGARARRLLLLVGRGVVGAGYGNIEQPQVNCHLAAMMDDVVEDHAA
jgi:hypothetical protein